MKTSSIKIVLPLVCLSILLVMPSAKTFSQNFQRAYGTALDNGFSKVIKDGANYYVLGQNEASEGAPQFGTVTRLDANGLHQWTLEPNIACVWNDGVLTPTGDLLVVGATLPLDATSKSLIGLVTPAGGGNFTWMRSYLEPGTIRNAFTRIIKNPSPQNAAFPYYVLGTQSKLSNAEINDVVLLNLNSNGVFNWKKKYESSDDNNFSLDLEVFLNGEMLIAGNNRIEGHVGKSLIFIADNTGTMLNGVQIASPDATFTDVAPTESSEIYATLTTNTNKAQVMKFASDLGLIWAGEIPQLTAANQIWEGSPGEIYITGRGNIGGIARDAILKLTDNGSVLDWLRYLNSGISFTGGSSWLMPNGQIAYTDGRNIPGGFGQNCAFMSLSDAELNTCSVSENIVSLQFFSPLPNGPILPLALSQEIPNGTEITIFQALNWGQSEVCSPSPCLADFTFQVDCGVVTFTDHSHVTGTPSWQWSFPGGIPPTSTDQNPVVTFRSCDSYQVCLTATGSDAGTVTCSVTTCHTVTIVDTIPPVALCLGIGVILDSNCKAVITPQMIDGGSTDDCLIQSMSVSPNMVTSCGLFPVTLTVTDWCGNSSTCETMVQAIENIPPVIRCPNNVIITSSGQTPCSAIVNNIQPTAVTDNCGVASVTYTISGATSGSGQNNASGSVFHQGISTVTYTATDNCGNTSTCSFTIKVNCSCDCTNNMLLNPGFFDGATPGNLGDSGNSTNWLTATLSPQIVPDDGCCDSTCVQMWGWLYNGESIYQQGLTFLAGHQYKISFCAKFVQPNSYANNCSFGFTAANSLINPFQCNNPCEDIGSSPQIYNTSWATYILPVWTPTQNYNSFYVRVFNTLGIKTWGRIDNICIQEISRPCCTDRDAFVENIHNAVHIDFDENTQEGIFTIGNLPACDSVSSIDWGDGHIDAGPFGANRVRRNRFLDHLLAKIHYQGHEYNQEVLPNPVCFDNLFSDSLNVFSSGQCVCGSISELFIRGPKNEFNQLVECGEVPYNLQCLPEGSNYELTGLYKCTGNICSEQATITWVLDGPGGAHSGTTAANPYFGISLSPAYLKSPGLYTLTFQGQCGIQNCSCEIQFNLDCPSLCTCLTHDRPVFDAAAKRGFAETVWENSCKACFTPIAVSDCDSITWWMNNLGGTLIGNSFGRQSVCFTFPGSGTYVVIMQVIRPNQDGSACLLQVIPQPVSVTCHTPEECSNSLIGNPTFSEGASAGGLNSGGHSNGWKASSGNPKLNEGQIESFDGWTIIISGNKDTGDILTRIEPVCLAKIAGMVSVRIAVNDSAPGGIFFAKAAHEKPKDQMKLAFSRSAVKRLIQCDSADCYELASIPLSSLDTSVWLDVLIPYDLSDWLAVDSCSNFEAVSVRPFVYLENALGSNQGGSKTYSIIQIDNLCFNEKLVAVHEPPIEQNIRIYPNPTSGDLIIQFKGIIPKEGMVQIVDLFGRPVISENLSPGFTSNTISLKEFPMGVYFVKLMDKGMPIWIQKVIKE